MASPIQTVVGKDESNPLTAEGLPKILRIGVSYSMVQVPCGHYSQALRIKEDAIIQDKHFSSTQKIQSIETKE